MPSPLINNNISNNEFEEGKNPPKSPHLQINKCLANYANANLSKLNNMLAQAPQNQNVSNAESLVKNFIWCYIIIYFFNLVAFFSSCPTTA